MAVDTMLIVERTFAHPRARIFRAFTDAAELAAWFAPDGWHVDPASVELDPQSGGRLRHTKVRDDDPQRRWSIEGTYTEVFEPEVIVTRQRILGVEGIDENAAVELRLEFTKTGRDNTLLRVVQGPYTPEAAVDYSDGWESILDHLAAHLATGS